MSDEVPELDDLWTTSPAFRAAAGKLLALPEPAVADLPVDPELAVDYGFAPSGLDHADWGVAVEAQRALYRMAGDVGAELVLKRLQELAGAELLPSVRQALIASIQPRPQPEHAERLRLTETDVLPVIESVRIHLDLRAVPRAGLDPSARQQFVPVAIVRMNLDEMVGGSYALVAQIPWAVAAKVAEELRAAVEQLEQIRADFGDSIHFNPGAGGGD